MSFASQYNALNPAQQKAVDTIDGPVMVIAGPGTGKTHILTLRIANILAKTDANPGNILALTFTDSAARTMRTRLVALIGTPAYSVRIETFHALADTLIREYPEYFPFTRDSTPLTQLEQFTIIRKLLDNPELKFLRTPGSKYHYVKDIISAISTLKRENITPEKFTAIVNDELRWFESEKNSLKKTETLKWEANLGKHQELVTLFAAYQKNLREQARFDFDDMLLTTREALENNPLLLASLQEQFQYILVDEYQDTNGVQNAIVDLIASFWGEDANLFVVGDPNQTIFRFQGAILSNTLGFIDRYPHAVIITLNTGYRSNQAIYSTAHQLLTPIVTSLANHPLAAPLARPLEAVHLRGKIELHELKNNVDELLFLVQKVIELLESGVNPTQIAILFKRNSEGEQLASLFSKANLPFHIERQNDILTDPLLIQFFTLLRLLTTLKTNTEARLLFDVLSYDWLKLQVPALKLLQFTRAFAAQKKVLEPFEFLLQDGELARLGETLSAWVGQEAKLTFPEFVELLAHESGFLQFLETHAQHTKTLTNFISLTQEVNRLAKANHLYRLPDFITYLDTMAEEKLTLSGGEITSEASITLSTVHKAKGREWQHVFLPFFREGYWGNARSKAGINLPEGIAIHPEGSDPENDERRLLFVALTRAKEELHLSFALTNQEGDRTRDNLLSPYASELPLLGKQIPTPVDAKLQTLFLNPATTTRFDQQTKDWLSIIVSTLPLSASALNTYLEDPRLFFERFILKLPEATKTHLAYGTAIHAALEFYYRQYKNNDHTYPALPSVLAIFEQVLRSHVLLENDLTSRLSQGRETLQAYLDEKDQNFPNIVALEETFGWRRGKVHLGDIELTGKIDRIDLVDQETKILTVIDYKTGKPKTMGDIEGTTKASETSARELTLPQGIRGAMKRQLLFYKLLLGLDPQYKTFKINEGVFEFVEPQKGAFTSRSVKLIDTDLEHLKQLIIEVANEIRSLKFLENL